MDLKQYAQLARIGISDEELHELEEDIEDILAYVEQIQEVSGEVEKEAGMVKNVMREDKNPHEPGVFTEELLEEAPETKGGYVKVKKIL